MSMSKPVATVIAQAARVLPRSPRSTDAASLIRAWLRAEGMQQDRWRNWKRPREEDKRWQFGEKVLREQYRTERGEWKNRDSQSLIDAAYDLIGQAAIVLEDADLAGLVVKAGARRKEVAETQRWRAADKERIELAKDLARREVAVLDRDRVLRAFHGQLPQDEMTMLDGLQLVLYDKYLELLGTDDLTTLDVGGRAASVTTPPVLPLRVDSEYLWVETDDSGTDYPIFVYRGNYGRVHVDIGWGAGTTVGERPSALLKSWLEKRNTFKNMTSARLVGLIEWRDGKLRAELEALGVRPGAEPARGAVGSVAEFESLLYDLKRAIYMWCTILDGYNIRWFRYDRGWYSWTGEAAIRELEATGTLAVHEVGDGDEQVHVMAWRKILT